MVLSKVQSLYKYLQCYNLFSLIFSYYKSKKNPDFKNWYDKSLSDWSIAVHLPKNKEAGVRRLGFQS